MSTPSDIDKARAFDAALAALVERLDGEIRYVHGDTTSIVFDTCADADTARLIIDGLTGAPVGERFLTGAVFGLGRLCVANPHGDAQHRIESF